MMALSILKNNPTFVRPCSNEWSLAATNHTAVHRKSHNSRVGLHVEAAARKGGDPFGREQSESKPVPLVAPSFVIPPPSKGSQYSSNVFNFGDDSGGGGADGAGRGGNGGDADNGGSGGSFGKGKRSNILSRLRLLLLFFAWSSCMYAIVSSVMRMAQHAVSWVVIPRWNGHFTDKVAETALDTCEDMFEEAAVGSAGSGELAGVSGLGVPSRGSGTTVHEGAQAATSAAERVWASGASGVNGGDAQASEAIAAEATALDEQQRAYLDILKRHSSAEAEQDRRGGRPRSSAAQSAGLYLMILSGVAFFSMVS